MLMKSNVKKKVPAHLPDTQLLLEQSEFVLHLPPLELTFKWK